MKNGIEKLRDFVRSTKVSLIDQRNTLVKLITEGFNKEISRLDDMELRFEKENLAPPTKENEEEIIPIEVVVKGTPSNG